MAIRYSVDELSSELRRARSSALVVEGGDDVDVLRVLEDSLAAAVGNLNFVIANDRSSVLQLWEQRATFPVQVAFLADSDIHIFSEAPVSRDGLVFTSGYSIENDCIRSTSIQEMLQATANTRSLWQSGLTSLERWFSAEVAIFRAGHGPSLDIGLRMCSGPDTGFLLTPEAEARIASAPTELMTRALQDVGASPLQFIRGKQLLHLASEVLRADGLNLSVASLRKIAARVPNPHFDDLTGRLRALLLGR